MKKVNKVVLFIILLGTINYFSAQDSTLLKADIKSAGKVIGLNFTENEIDSVQLDLTENLNDYDSVRNFKLENSVFPAIGFNPVPNHFDPTVKENEFEISNYSSTELPENRDDLAFYSIGQLAELVKSRKITSLELTNFFLERLKKYGPVLECVVTLTEELAVEQAESADK